jgi:cell division septum initiation protein DivIVA
MSVREIFLMGRLTSIVGALAALVMCAVSGAMNYLFMASLGKTPLEGHVLGAASAAADVLKALLPFFIAWSWRDGRIIAAGSGLVAILFFAAFSLLSAIGFAADNRGLLVEGRENLNRAYARMQREIQEAEAQRAALPSARPASIISEEIAQHQQNRRWSATRQCEEATASESRSYCEVYFSLRAELASANEADRLAESISTLQSEIQKLRGQGAGQDTDPQVSLFARIMGVNPEPVRLALIIAIAVLVELGASLGLYLASGHRDGSRTPSNTDTSQKQTDAGSDSDKPIGSVEDFCLEALAPSRCGALRAGDLYQAYESWCEANALRSLDANNFAQQFAAIARELGLPAEQDRWRGIAIEASKAA